MLDTVDKDAHQLHGTGTEDAPQLHAMTKDALQLHAMTKDPGTEDTLQCHATKDAMAKDTIQLRDTREDAMGGPGLQSQELETAN